MKFKKIIQNNQKGLATVTLAFAMICAMLMSFSFMATSVSAEEGNETAISKVEVTIDYEAETIEALHALTETEVEGDILVMYALGLKGSDAASLTKAKWMPLYGEDLDISKYIPKKAGSVYYVAFRNAADVATESGFATAIAVELKARPAAAKTEVIYDNDKQQITTSQTGDYLVKLGASLDWIPLTKDTPISLPLDFLPNGSTAVFKKAALESESETSNTSSFASAEIKLKLPKQTKAPKVDKVTIVPPNETKKTDAYLKGITDKMELMLYDENGEPIVDTKGNQVWEPLSKNIELPKLESLLKQKGAGKVTDTGNKKYLLTIRLAASGTKGVSGKSLITLDTSQYDTALAGLKSSAPSATVSANLTASASTGEEKTITITLANITFAESTDYASVNGIFTVPNSGGIDLSGATYTVPADKKTAVITLPAGTYLNAGEVTITIARTALAENTALTNDLTVKVTVKAS